MNLKVIASGSSGNCYVLKSNTGSLLIECGIPFKKIQKALEFDLSSIIGAIGSHAHADHTGSARDVIKSGIDIYTSIETISTLGLSSYRAHPIEPLEQFNIGDFTILGFPTEHDCEGSMGFIIQYRIDNFKVIFLTDSYYCKYKFTGLNAILIECNYIKETLDANIAAGLIDERMKPRLLQSHFSLEHVKEFLQANDLSECRRIILLHLSDMNSSSARMIKEIQELTGIETSIAEPNMEINLELYPY